MGQVRGLAFCLAEVSARRNGWIVAISKGCVALGRPDMTLLGSVAFWAFAGCHKEPQGFPEPLGKPGPEEPETEKQQAQGD